MTVAYALLIKVIEQYSQLGYRLSVREVEKLAYFVQEVGEPLHLHFTKGLYGPYAHNLDKVLERLEGHFIHGFGGSRKPNAEIDLLPDAVNKANHILQGATASQQRLQRVSTLIEGFETPYGLVLLAFVHWLATHETPVAVTAEQAIADIQQWNSRKQEMFQPAHIEVAWQRLNSEGLV